MEGPKRRIETMPKALVAALFAGLFATAAYAAKDSKEPFKLIGVSDLEKALASKAPPVVFDANNKATRKDEGVIPGAKLLSSSGKYSVAKELPTDKKTPLVFYCANTQCMASHSAAGRAAKAGFKDVSVMA